MLRHLLNKSQGTDSEAGAESVPLTQQTNDAGHTQGKEDGGKTFKAPAQMTSPKGQTPLLRVPPAQGMKSPSNSGVRLEDLGILRSVVSKWKSFSTKRKEHGDKSNLYRKGPAPLDEPGKKKRRNVLRCTHGTLDSNVESLGEEEDGFSECSEDHRKSVASSKGLILYFAKLATTRDEDEAIDLQFVYSLLQGGADINFTDRHGQTILHEIARAWHTDVAKFLISHGASINKGDKFGRTPLHLAVSVGYTEMILFLLDNGANIHCRTKGEYQTPIHYAAKNNAVASLRTLLKQSGNINDRDYKERTPLFVAAEAGRSEAARFLLEAGAPAAVYDDKGNSCLSLMVEKMPGIAMEALEQFHSMDRALRKKFYYLNYLEKMSATDEGDMEGQSPQSAKTALQVVVQYSELELIMHPAIHRLLTVKWDLFGKWSSIWIVVVNLVYTLIWTVLGLLLPRDGNYYTPLTQYWWRIALECIGCIMTMYFILTEVLDARNVEKRENIYKAWRAQQVERDLEHCHPRWAEERRYLEGELERIQRNTRGNYFRNAWNIIDWMTHGAVLMVVLTRVFAVVMKSDDADTIHPRVFAVSLILIWLRMMKSCRAFRALGPFITLLGHVVSDTLKFAFLYFEFFIPYSCAFWILFGGDRNAELMESKGIDSSGWRKFNDLIYSVWEITLVGNYPWDALLAVDRRMAQALVGTYLAMSAVVCLNLYIALMSDTFARVYENAKANAIMQQAMQILNIERTLGKKKLIKIKKFIASDCAPQEVYCATEENERTRRSANEQVMYHIDTSIESVKDLLKSLLSEVRDPRKFPANGPKSGGVGKISTLPTSATPDVKAWQEAQGKRLQELCEVVSELSRRQELLLSIVTRRQSSASVGNDQESDALTTDSQVSTLRRKKKKRKERGGSTDNERQNRTDSPAPGAESEKKRTKSRKPKE